MKKLNVAIVGTGFLGSRHLKVCSELKDKINLVSICDTDSERASALSQQYGVPFLTDYRQLVGKIDAVNICTPTVTHCDIARFFLENNIHTFVEKPMTYSLDEADILIELAERKSLKLQVGHVERFNSAFRAVERIAQKPLFIECHRLNQFPNRSLDIGVVMDLMIHDIDIICGLIDSPVSDIQAVGVPVLTALEDIANARVTFENGCVCNLTASRVSPEVMRKIRIFLQNAYISLDYVQQEAFIYRKDNGKITKEALPIEKEEPLKKELESFIDCIVEDRKPVVSGIEGKQALAMAQEIITKVWKKPLPV